MQAASRAAYNLGITQEATTQELFKAMEQGKLMAEEFLPEFSKELLKAANEGGALAEAMQTTGAAIGRFQTNFWLANKTFNESGFDKNIRILINTFSDFLQESEGLFQFLGEMSEFVIYPLRAAGEALELVGIKLTDFAESSEGNIAKLKALSAFFLSLFKTGRKLLAVFLLIPMASSGLTKFVREGNLEWSEWLATLGSIAGILAWMYSLKKPKILGNIGGSVLGGAAAGAGAGVVKRSLPVKIVSLLGLGSMAKVASVLYSKKIGGSEQLDYLPQGSEGMTPFVPQPSYNETPGADPRASQRSMLDRFGEAVTNWADKRIQQYEEGMNQPWNPNYQPEPNARTSIINNDVTFNIEGGDAAQVEDSVIRVINEYLIRPTSANEPVTEK